MQKGLKLIGLVFSIAFVFAFVACSDYKAPTTAAEINAAKKAQHALDLVTYYANEDDLSALVEVSELKAWIDNGMVTVDNATTKMKCGKPVVILNVDGTTPAKIIAGAYQAPQNSYFTEERSDGPVSVGNMVASGAKMDAALRTFGITKDTVVVITGADLGTNNIHRVFWTFYYWGFSKNNLKVLNASRTVFETEAGVEYVCDTTVSGCLKLLPTTPSTFSVTDLPNNRVDKVRYTLGQILADADNNAYQSAGSGNKVMIATMNPSNAVKNEAGATVTYVANTGAINGRIHGAVQVSPTTQNAGTAYVSGGKYKTAAEIADNITRLDMLDNNTKFLPADKAKIIITHCGAGQSTAPHWFVISQILGYKNAAIYDGSWNEWGVMNVYTTLNNSTPLSRGMPNDNKSYLKLWLEETKFQSDNGTVVDLSDFNNGISKMTGSLRNFKYDTSRFTDYLQFNPTVVPTNLFDNSYSGDAREINKADKAYQERIWNAIESETPSTGGSGGSVGGGGAPSGC